MFNYEGMNEGNKRYVRITDNGKTKWVKKDVHYERKIINSKPKATAPKFELSHYEPLSWNEWWPILIPLLGLVVITFCLAGLKL